MSLPSAHVTQGPQPPYPHQPPTPGAWGQPAGQQPRGEQPWGQPAVPAVPGQPPLPAYAYGYAPQAPPQVPSSLYVAAGVVNWVVLGLLVLGTCGFGIVAAAWFIPMTIAIQKGARDREKHTALAVCTLLFCNLVSGILMLVEDGNRMPRPYA